ncbi:MAG: SRPBCC family protein [Candidatus Zixiibacteriota bacterium]|nr:MAG: SRPBCC family protein [candidate division Zixibacteria bacterium]
MRRAATALILNILSWLLYLAVLIVLYFACLRDMQMTWGATDEDVNRPMMGDELLANPEMNATRAVEINATPEEIWPWMVQIGYGKAGFYGFDNLDNGGNPSAYHILPEHQDLKAGDSIPGGEWEGKMFHILEVTDMNPDREMVWVFLKGTPWGGGTWSWGLYPIDNQRTRLVTRLRQKYDMSSFQGVISWSMIDAIEILMMRTTLRGIKMRAESK